MSYHDRIMNISAESLHEDTLGQSMAYRRGQRDARHIAAEIANEADAEIERLKADLDRLHRERDSFQEQCRVMAEENERVRSVLEAAYALAIGWAGYYQHLHKLDDIHPNHKAILDACQKELPQ